MPIKQKPPGVTPNGFSSRLPVSWFCRQIQTAFSPFVPFESAAVSSIGGRRVCLTRKGPLPAPLVFAMTRALPHHGHLRSEQAIAI